MTEAIYIVLRNDLRIGPKLYEVGDRFKPEKVLNDNLLTEAQLEAIKDQRYYAALTKETFAICMARRPAGAARIPHGFTEEFLLAEGYLEPAKEEKPAAEAKAKPKTHKAVKPKLDGLPPTPESIQYENLTITPKPRGAGGLAPIHYVTDAYGILQRDTGFMTLDKAKAWIDEKIKADQKAKADLEQPRIEGEQPN
jgi:hypothetical protein